MTSSEVIQLMISPAFMVSSCSILLSTSSNKSSAVIDRIRQLSEENSNHKHQDQIQLLFNRLHKIRNAIFCYELAIALFIISSLQIGLISFTQINFNTAIVITFLAGMTSVLIGIIYLWLESKISFEIIKGKIIEE